MTAEPARNAPCHCGSGKRYKHCHGRDGAVEAVPASASAPVPTRLQALAAHRTGQLGLAETLYRRALEENAADVDALHMLGVVQLQRLRHREALDLLWDAAERSNWSIAQVRHNLGIVLGKLVTREANARQSELLEQHLALERARSAMHGQGSPLVTVVVAAQAITAAIASVAAQTYANLELVVIGEGAAVAAREASAVLRIPVRAIARQLPRHAALNEGAAAASGTYLAFLDTDDGYAPERIAALVDEIARRRLPWGFSLVADADAHANGADPASEATFRGVAQRQRLFLGTPPASFALVEHNVAIATGNLFVERGFFQTLGGFRDLRQHLDWDFSLRASAHAEPAVVRHPLYLVRGETSAAAAASDHPSPERDRVLGDFFAAALSGTNDAPNPLAPHRPENRAALLKLVFRANQGALIPAPLLRALAAEWRTKAEPSGRTRAGSATASATRTALVVLGMHRSGTSAMSRVLNLCGAFLPEKVKPGKLGVNPKGFWEPEAVLDLNVRLMGHLGGDWDRVDFVLPDSGSFVEEFLADARELLAAEYGDEATIVIKDPRICVLAPLWHRALEAAGFRPVYVVPMRNPLEVAQSLNARGDMTVARGLALWLDYMKQVVAFADRCPDVMFVTYTELLDDWRRVVHGIAHRLGVALDTTSRADDVDRFLERSLRNQAADAATLDALPDDATVVEVRALYRACLDRCESDAIPLDGRAATVAAPSRRDAVAASTLGFVLCIENNGIRDQALMLCESIRRYGGRHRGGPILAFAPRPGLGVDASTRARLAELAVEYIDEPLNTQCLSYAPANRVFAGAYAEMHARTDFLAVLDSDTIWLDEPAIPEDADVAVRVVDAKGSATRGAGDPFEPYWTRVAEIAGIALDRLPIVRSTIGHEQIRASYNAGLTVARRGTGILARCADLFRASLDAGLRPYRGTGMNIHASTGDVGEAGSEYWGSSQTAMTLAIWASTSRVHHYPDHYNVPLHLIASDGEVDPRWLRHPPVHLHYHWMFGRRHHETAMALIGTLGVPRDRVEWIESRIPFAD